MLFRRCWFQIWLLFLKILKFHNFSDQDKLFRILILNTKHKIDTLQNLSYVFFTKNLVEMKQNNISVTSWWHIYNY